MRLFAIAALAGTFLLVVGSAQAVVPGALDTTFGGTGMVTTSIGPGRAEVHALALQPNGKIVAAGTSDSTKDNVFTLARYNANGSLDKTFNGTGIVKTAAGWVVFALALQPDGKIVAAGVGGASSTQDNNVFTLVRFNANGSLDKSFNGTGIVKTPIGDESQVYALALQPDGKIVAAGVSGTGYYPQDVFALARYNANGSLDTTFNGTGTVTTAIPDGAAFALALQPDGKLVAAGYSTGGITFARYNPDGSLDTSFNGTGIVMSGVGQGYGMGLALQPDGKIVAAGDSPTPTAASALTLIRYNANGSLDTTFNHTGTVITQVGTLDYAYALARQPDGRLVAAGYFNHKFGLARYNANGSLDKTFNGTGIVTTAIPGFGAQALALQSNGKIVAAGYRIVGSCCAHHAFALARYVGKVVPKISAFTPARGPVGTVVTITGSGFTGTSVVKFHGTAAAKYTVISATKIKATVAAHTTSGKISITTPSGTATSATVFTVR